MEGGAFSPWFVLALAVAVLVLLLWIRAMGHFLLLHALVELFSIAVAAGIFMIAWNSRRYFDNGYLLFLGIGYLFVAVLDLVHMLAYEGMGVIPGVSPADTDPATQLWIAARSLQALTLLGGFVFLRRQVPVAAVTAGYLAVLGLVLFLILARDVFPACLPAGQGLTTFKIVSEYVIIAMLLTAMVLLWRSRDEFDRLVLQFLLGSIALTVVSEFLFTIYPNAYSVRNLLGHFFKIAAFYLLYKALIETGLRQPYAVLFRNCKLSEESLRASEERYRTVADFTYDWEYWLDPNGRMVYVSPSCRRLTGYSPAEFLENPALIERIIHPDDRARCADHQHEPSSTGELRSLDFRIVDRTGQQRWIGHVCQSVTADDGRPLGIRASNRDITARKEAEMSLQETAALNELLLDSLPHPAMLIRRDRTILAANRIAREVGAVAGGLCWRDFGRSEHLPECREAAKAMDGAGADAPFHCAFCLGDKALDEGTAQNRPDVEMLGKIWDTYWIPLDADIYLHYAIDVTEARRKELERDRLLSQVRQVNERLEGRTRELMLRSQELQRARDGLEKRVEERTEELATINDQLKQELEWRELAERALRESEEKYRTIFENSPLGIAHFDHKATLTTCNERLAEIIGTPRERLVGLDLLSAVKDSRMFAALESCLAGQRAHYDGRTTLGQGRSAYLNIYFAPIADDENHLLGGVAICQDVTQRREAELALQHQTQELARSNAELEQFAYVASHDLQEPLRMVASFMQLIKRRYEGKLDADADEFIGHAVDGALRMQRLISDLLQFSRVNSRAKPPEPIGVDDVLRRVVANLKVAIERSEAAITWGHMPTVTADDTQLTQLFQNLLDNAMKFRREDQAPKITISADREDAFWRFTVADNGIGFEQEYADKIFVIFQRLHARDKYRGTGIGLAICKKIVERHGGRIWVKSELGRGTTFHFTLPAGPAEAPA